MKWDMWRLPLMPKAKVPNNAICAKCNKPFHRSPSYLKEYTHVFCSNACRYQFFTGKSNPHNPKTLKRVELTCKHCDKTFYRATYLANIGKYKFCSQECFWEWKSNYSGSYHKRDLESSPKQMLLRYLIRHGFGIGHPYANECEEVLCNIKSGFYVPGL